MNSNPAFITLYLFPILQEGNMLPVKPLSKAANYKPADVNISTIQEYLPVARPEAGHLTGKLQKRIELQAFVVVRRVKASAIRYRMLWEEHSPSIISEKQEMLRIRYVKY
ncbi:uncharacterized protein MCYG_03045 [Microsporum canis CBS 113480]|uniref:Uncharacterized protein n=1 Tax=Arthroderma otae (strain ATCC MYA-4605 / CBS 113480) TaxID=554155 RepID=C5FKK4_ARTOC|nr:uncharacterized protein MCYG_03045 [Microsporum canis CBS 113480]EEQ30226.1 predicted protein [Microsporum canis CBS 113480]